MRLKVTEQITKEVEVKLPAFRKDICHFYRVLNENTCTQITSLSGHYAITMIHSSLAFSETEDCTEEEFDTAFDKILEKIENN